MRTTRLLGFPLYFAGRWGGAENE
ncbi:MAG: hypothetical protein QOI45_1618, partial [Thermoleophilaceae bacterium]|nr:hypothetical protein [Thermoleophilaceae bacterium]